jgi:hypothetical protein
MRRSGRRLNLSRWRGLPSRRIVSSLVSTIIATRIIMVTATRHAPPALRRPRNPDFGILNGKGWLARPLRVA